MKQAIAEFQRAIDLDPRLAPAYNSLGNALYALGGKQAAGAAFQKAIALDPKGASAHTSLGNVLQDEGRTKEAVAAYRRAIDIDPQLASAHNNLGNALYARGDAAGAMAAYRRALELDPNLVLAHSNLAAVLHTRGDTAGAVAALRRAVALGPQLVWARYNLGVALLHHGQFAEAGAVFDQASKLLPPKDPWRALVAEQARASERLRELDAKLPAILRGEVRVRDAEERVALARLCRMPSKRLYAASARFFAAALAQEPGLARAGYRYPAACAAALAVAGRGVDSARLGDKERTRLRRQALEWLRADLALLKADVQGGDPAVGHLLQRWRTDPDLAAVRTPEALAKVFVWERRTWQEFWADVDALHRKAAAGAGQIQKALEP